MSNNNSGNSVSGCPAMQGDPNKSSDPAMQGMATNFDTSGVADFDTRGAGEYDDHRDPNRIPKDLGTRGAGARRPMSGFGKIEYVDGIFWKFDVHDNIWYQVY
jgi:hypothetical protein